MACLHALRAEHVIGETPLKLHIKHPDTQPRGVHGALRAEEVGVAGAGEVAGDAAERSRHPPGAQLEAVHDGVCDPVEVVGQVEQLPVDVAAKRALDPRHDLQPVQIPARAAVEHVRRLPGGLPVEVTFDVQAERIGREQFTDGAHVRALEQSFGLEQTDALVT